MTRPPEDHALVGYALAGMGALVALWALFWPVPTEVVGKGVLIYPDQAGLLDSRAAGQVRRLKVRVGDRVSRGQVLMELRLPVLERELRQQQGNLAQLERQNQALDRRDALRLQTERQARDTALARLEDTRRRTTELAATYDERLQRLEWLARKKVVAPLASEVVSTEQAATRTAVDLDAVAVERRRVLADYQKVKLAVETEGLDRRFRIDDLRRQIEVTKARLAYDGTLLAERDGEVLDLQVIEGQTVAPGQRLGTLGRAGDLARSGRGLRAVAYLAPADGRRLQPGLPVELVPLWDERGRFGGIVGRVERVLTLPATEDDISTTVGNTPLARSLVDQGPVLRSEISLERDPRSHDGFRWTLSRGSRVFPVREGLTVAAHAYVEWRPPISYLVPGWRRLTGTYRNLRLSPPSLPAP